MHGLCAHRLIRSGGRARSKQQKFTKTLENAIEKHDGKFLKPHWCCWGQGWGKTQSASGGADLLLEERGVSQDGHCQGEHCTFCLSVSALLTPQFELFLHFVLGGGGSGNKFGVEAGMG